LSGFLVNAILPTSWKSAGLFIKMVGNSFPEGPIYVYIQRGRLLFSWTNSIEKLSFVLKTNADDVRSF